MKIDSYMLDVFLSSTKILNLSRLVSIRLELKEEGLLLFCFKVSSFLLFILFLLLVEIGAVAEVEEVVEI